MKDDDFKLLRGFASEQTDRRTDICECRVAFATEKIQWMVKTFRQYYETSRITLESSSKWEAG